MAYPVKPGNFSGINEIKSLDSKDEGVGQGQPGGSAKAD